MAKETDDEIREAEEKRAAEKRADDTAQNWLDLASHFQAKVHKRTSELSYLHTRAGFLIAADVIAVQAILSLPKMYGAHITWLIIGTLFAFASLAMAITSMHIGKSTTALNPDEMFLKLTETPLDRHQFGNWLARSYAAANKAFNGEYNKKYYQQIAAAILLVLSLAVTVGLKGIKVYG